MDEVNGRSLDARELNVGAGADGGQEQVARRLASGTAHQINNLLTVLSGHSSLLLETVAPDDAARPGLEAISSACGSVATLAEQLLSYAGERPCQATMRDVDAVIADALPALDSDAGPSVSVAFRTGPKLPDVEVDPDRLVDALRQIARYARALLVEGGRMILATDGVGERVSLTVRIQGEDVNRVDLDALFLPYAADTGVARSEGMRVAAARGDIAQFGGRMWAVRDGPDLVLGITFRTSTAGQTLLR